MLTAAIPAPIAGELVAIDAEKTRQWRLTGAAFAGVAFLGMLSWQTERK
jgi:hypothetical protein